MARVEVSDPNVTKARLTDWCRECLANYKASKHILMVDALPPLAID